MTRFFDLDAANDALPEVRGILTRLADERQELIRLRDEVLERQSAVEAAAEATAGGSGTASSRRADAEVAELRRLRLRMQGVIDQMQAGVARIDELGITLRDIETGLIDFPALVTGRQVWLCWRLGEDDVAWWHELTTGVAGRRSLAELE
ncbi:MAG: DUF2203 domain-containing protein [Chloroflexi bacterium]|nr:DUF2203 domain-containing protein [Chloroflexota bacterium]